MNAEKQFKSLTVIFLSAFTVGTVIMSLINLPVVGNRREDRQQVKYHSTEHFIYTGTETTKWDIILKADKEHTAVANGDSSRFNFELLLGAS